MNPGENEKNYPGVKLAYPFAVESYERAVKRFEVMDSRIQTLLALFVTLSLAMLVFAKDQDMNLRSWWIGLAGLCFLGAIIWGTCGRLCGKLKLVHPQILYDKYLRLSEWKFQKDFIYWAGENYQSNIECIEKKHRTAVAITFLFCLEAGFLVAWMFSLHGPQ